MLHYHRDGWTYHAKGLWIWPPSSSSSSSPPPAPPEPPSSSDHPILTVIGSSNHSERSLNRDVELSFCLVTTDASVREQLHEEQKRLRLHAKDAAEAEHGGPLTAMVARALAALLRTFF